MHRVPIHHLELVSEEDALVMKIGLGQPFLHPVSQTFSFIGGQFVPTEEHTNRLEGKPSGGDVLGTSSFMDRALGMVIHLAFELGIAAERVVCLAVILVGLHITWE
jgi:hypothetical protein